MDPTGVSLVVAVPAAILGAASMGLASAAQARASKKVPTGKTLHPILLLHLVRQPLWLLGIGATVAGLGLQVVALAWGPLMLVQPLLVTALPFASLFSALLAHHRPDRVIVAGTFVCVIGLSALLVLARPTGGSNQLIASAPLGALALGLGVVALGGLAVSWFGRGPRRVLGLALATAVFYGVAAGLMKVAAGELRQGFAVPFTHWSVYAVCVIGPIGFLLSQNTFQQGTLISPALAVITTVDPLVGVAIGVWWLGESASNGPAVLAGEVVAALVIIGGIWVLAMRGEYLRPDAAPAPPAVPAPPPLEPAEPSEEPAAQERTSSVQHFGPPPDLRSSETSTKTGW
jgi:drug/metabolite transporter (DMT)-like permease